MTESAFVTASIIIVVSGGNSVRSRDIKYATMIGPPGEMVSRLRKVALQAWYRSDRASNAAAYFKRSRC